MQKTEQISPIFLELDAGFAELKPYQSPFIKSLTFDVNLNPISGIGTNNPTGEGQNQLVKTPTKSNLAVPDVLLPEGYNKHIGAFYSITTQELYHFNYNINGDHGIYVLSGNTGLWQKVIEDPELLFTDSQENYIAGHRVFLRFIQDSRGNVIEKYLLITEGNSWQKYINVIAAISTNGFDAVQYPYWSLHQPHFDRRELLEWPVRPPMIKPTFETIPNTLADKGKLNRFIDKGLQIAYVFQLTDGRTSTVSPYSLPVLIKSEDYLNNPDNIPKNVRVTFYAGGPQVEKLLVYVRSAKKGTNSLPSITEWGDWYLYETINKFPNSNSNDVLGTAYWLRTDPWADYSYDTVYNTIQYTFDLSKVRQIVFDQDEANRLQTGIPQLSIAMSDVEDAAMLANNRYGYPNFSKEVMSKLTATVVEKADTSCTVGLRNIRLYAYIGRMGDDFDYVSQVGYYNGEDKQMRFGGMYFNIDDLLINVDESKAFQLDFADKNAFRCYLKGTPYYADGKWFKVNSDNSLDELDELLDVSSISVKEGIKAHFLSGGYYVCVFDITAPADRYIACLGRHNVESSGDYRSQSTYIIGIANSRAKSILPWLTVIKPAAISDYSKEIEIDCTAGDVDVWGIGTNGNNLDLFYVYCPHVHQAHGQWRFIEGYLKESEDNPLPVEMFPYRMVPSGAYALGFNTDKNGFYWAYTQIRASASRRIEIHAKINCEYPYRFEIPTSGTGVGWMQNTVHYLDDQLGGEVGLSNKIMLYGRITSLDGSQNYSNISVSIKDGATAYTNSFGVFTLVIHSGIPENRIANVYVNSGGNFRISTSGCGFIPLFQFNEGLVPCYYPMPLGTERAYPIGLNAAVQIDNDRETSLKEDGKYSVGIYGADLAGRLMYVNDLSDVYVPSFLERNNLAATFFRILIDNIDLTAYPDIKWITFCVSKNISIKRYIQWVGDKVKYIDNNGQSVTDAANAVFASIKINSLYNSNISKNFSLLSTYEFVKGDRVRILDDGDGNLYDVATYGDPIDLLIEGTNYLQAATASGLLPEGDTVTQTEEKDVSLIVRFDYRLTRLLDKEGFWLEIYTPTEQSDLIPYYEAAGFHPVINGKIAEFKGFVNGQPDYEYLNSVDLDFWDTYFFNRNITIPDVGNKFFSHPFQSQNVTDNWGADIISGGRVWIKNDNAKQYWLPGETAKSDPFLKEGILNGLAIFRSGNKKDFGSFPFGGITGVHSERNVIFFVCENDWFITDFNFHNAFVNEQGVVVANLDRGLSTPHQKIGSKFGMAKKDTGTLIFYDKEAYWYNRKDPGLVRMNYRDAVNTATKSEAEQGGMQSWFDTKTAFITVWNNAHTKENCFDVVAGEHLGKIYITFRCRRNNSNEISSYLNHRRNWQVNFQETIVYDAINRGWVRCEAFTPEGYGSVKGDATGPQLVAFSAGKPYLHNSAEGFGEFFGVNTTPVIMGVFNGENSVEKIYDGIYYSGNPSGWFLDLCYTDFKNSFSYLSRNQFVKNLNNYYAAIMRNGNSYPSNVPEELFESMLFSGYRMRGKYLVFRMVGDYAHRGEYKELGVISGCVTADDSNKK